MCVCVGRISKKVVGVIRWNFESQQPVGQVFNLSFREPRKPVTQTFESMFNVV